LAVCSPLEDARLVVYEDEREVIATYVSTYGLQRQSHKGKQSSNEVFEWPSHHIEHTITHNKTTKTRTFPINSNTLTLYPAISSNIALILSVTVSVARSR